MNQNRKPNFHQAMNTRPQDLGLAEAQAITEKLLNDARRDFDSQLTHELLRLTDALINLEFPEEG